jgi:hypothetical protein
VRQWVLSVPKRLRYFMQRDGELLNMVLRIFLRVIAQALQAHSPGVAKADQAALHIDAVAFIHRFGSSLNEHVHFHVCVVDGVFEVMPPAHRLRWTACAKLAMNWCTAAANNTANPAATNAVPVLTNCTSPHWS